MAHDQELSRGGLPYSDKALFVNRVIEVRDRDGERIAEYSCCLLKLYAVIPLAETILIGIP